MERAPWQSPACSINCRALGSKRHQINRQLHLYFSELASGLRKWKAVDCQGFQLPLLSGPLNFWANSFTSDRNFSNADPVSTARSSTIPGSRVRP